MQEFILTFIIALVSLMLSIYNIYDLNRQRKRDLRWKKAEKAKELIDEIYENDYSYCAIQLCCHSDAKMIIESKTQEINYDSFVQCLKHPERDASDNQSIIFECIDELVYYFHNLENWITIGLVEFSDLKPTFEWIIFQLGDNKVHLTKYADKFGYKKCSAFLARF